MLAVFHWGRGTSMLSFTYAIFLLVQITTCLGLRETSISTYNLTVLESLPGVPLGWREGAAVPASKTLGFRIALRPENAFAFEQQVIAISTPDHPLYGQHMEQQEVRRMLQPSPEASNAILQWLTYEGVPATNIRDAGDWITFHVTADEAERILDTRFHYYSNSANQIESIRTLRYSVPEDLHEYIQMIQPTTRFSQLRAQNSTISDLVTVTAVENAPDPSVGSDTASCNTAITPQCLKDLYNFGDYQGKAVEGMYQNTSYQLSFL